MSERRRTVLLVRPEPSRGLGAFYRNLGLTTLATHLSRHGLDPRLVDVTFDGLPDATDDGAKIALFGLYIDDFARGVEISHRLKQMRPGLVTAVGGPHATLLGRSLFSLADAFDLVCLGDCLPEAMPILAAVARGGPLPADRIIGSSAAGARVDTLIPDYRIWPDGRYFPVFPVETSRGCRQHCPFCTDPVLRRGLALSAVDQTMRTLCALVTEHGQVWVRFVDSSMSSLGAGLDHLLDALTEAELPVRWSAYAYPHDITPGLAARMAAAGCQALFLGIESLADRVRVGKHHTKRPAEVTPAVNALHDNGIFVHGNFIIGLPGETPETVAQTLDGLDLIPFDSVGGGPFYLTPGSTYHRSPGRFGIQILDADWPLKQHINFYNSDHEYFRTTTLTQPQMRQLATVFRQQVQQRDLGCWIRRAVLAVRRRPNP